MLTEEVFARAVEVLKKNVTLKGLKASSTYYNQVWARDSFISFLGANMLADESLIECARSNIDTFTKARADMGQIANFYDLKTGQPEFGFSGSTDSSCWFIIGLASLYGATGDRSLLGAPLDAALNAYRWLRHQDANNSWLIDSPEGADWMDAAIQRTGKTLYNNTLFLLATKCVNQLCSFAGHNLEAPYKLDYRALLQRFSDVFLPDAESPQRVSRYWPRLGNQMAAEKPLGFSQEYYLHYLSFARTDTHFDTLSNLLCILSGLCGNKTSSSIVAAIRSRKLSEPYPVRVLDPPYVRGEPGFDAEFDSRLPIQHRSGPFAYHNGGVWPFVGGLHVCALNRLRIDSAETELERLAKANEIKREGENAGFNEWLHGVSGASLGQSGQSWSAGMFVAAVFSTRGKEMLSFLD